MTTALATHLHVELWGVDEAVLNDPERLELALRGAADAAGCTVLGRVGHRFQPQGASVVILVAESHLSIHTWPEHQYAAADILTCGATLPGKGVEMLVKLLNPSKYEIREHPRGIVQPL